jgi:hypothetical protein
LFFSVACPDATTTQMNAPTCWSPYPEKMNRRKSADAESPVLSPASDETLYNSGQSPTQEKNQSLKIQARPAVGCGG